MRCASRNQTMSKLRKASASSSRPHSRSSTSPSCWSTSTACGEKSRGSAIRIRNEIVMSPPGKSSARELLLVDEGEFLLQIRFEIFQTAGDPLGNVTVAVQRAGRVPAVRQLLL